MVGRLLSFCFTFGTVIGVIYLSIILWWGTGYTPIDLIEAIIDTVVGPLQEVIEILG